MNEVKDLCQRILSRPAPPMRDGAHVLAIAKRAARRRAQIAAATSLSVVAIAGITAAALPHSRPSAPHAAVSGQPVTSPPQVPTNTAANANGARITQVLAEALPTGYSSRLAFDGHGTATWVHKREYTSMSDRYVFVARLFVSDDNGGQGSLSVIIVSDDSPPPMGDLCSPAVAARLATYVSDRDPACEVVTLDGVPIRTSVAAGNSIAATRFLVGGFLTVRWTQDTSPTSLGPTDPNQPWWKLDDYGQKPLATSPFTARRLAEVAANPKLLP